jgi:hypothetical protein
MSDETAYPQLRYPQYLVEYMAAQHGFTFPETAPASHVPLYDQVFAMALDTQRLRQRALPALLKSIEQEAGWVRASLSAAPKNSKPAEVYEQIGDGTHDGMTLRRLAHALNEREAAINGLCRALEALPR